MVKSFSYLVFLITFLSSCDFKKRDGEILPQSAGKYGEVLVVVDSTYNKGELKHSLDSIFLAPMVGLPQMETQFRTSFVIPQAFKSILKRSRNILKLSIGPKRETDVEVSRNVWAKDQILIRIIAPSQEAAKRILKKNTQTIRDYFNEEELNRLQQRHRKKLDVEGMKVLSEKFKLKLELPPAFVKMLDSSDGIWFKKEKQIGQHLVIQGLSIYSMPYESDSTFSLNEMISSRNAFTSEFIEGSREGSYMKVYQEYKPDQKQINLNGLFSVEYRGLWKMENDFMGGPFIHYILVDEMENKVIHLDGFVYAPKFDKREYLRELESVIKTATIVN